MANIFKSREVYKHVTKPGDVHQLIPVRGMFVANQHRSPFYVDHTLEITNVGNVPAAVIPQLETDIDMYTAFDFDPTLSISNSSPTIVDYYTVSLSKYLPETFYPSLTVDNQPVNIYEYTTSYYDTNDPMLYSQCFVSVTNDTVAIERIDTVYETEIDGFLQITEFNTTKAIIS